MFCSQVLAIIWLWLAIPVLVNGQQPVETHAKIVGGIPINIINAPYMVSIRNRYYHELKFGLGHICGGALISSRVVCTAAHCFAINNTSPLEFRAPVNYVIVAGTSVLNVQDEFTRVFLVAQIIPHGNFSFQTLSNDVALVMLNGLLPPDFPTIRPLALAKERARPNTVCLIAGWGNKQSQLHIGVVPILQQEVCRLIYFFLPPEQLCAGWLQGGIDACRGDSGGPLICNGSLTGIISWGFDCGRMFLPGVYTNISHLFDWIKTTNETMDYSMYRLEVRSINGCKRYLNVLFKCPIMLMLIILHLV